MGITFQLARFLLEAAEERPLGQTLTLGRLQLFVGPRDVPLLARGRSIDRGEIEASITRDAEHFLGCLGATDVTALDFSAYEGASVVHDLNVPVPAGREQMFDTVVDGGTLEHVFNFPVAMASSMRMLRTGGRLFLCTPANNLMGHGFYQLSPELFYRCLSPAHGFEVEAMEVVQSRYVSTELDTVAEPFRVIDPDRLGTRTVVMGRHPLSLLVRARKVRHLTDPFATPPQQSDYVRAWTGGPSTQGAQRRKAQDVVEAMWSRLPGRVKWKLWNEYGRWYRHTLRNRAWFRPLRSR